MSAAKREHIRALVAECKCAGLTIQLCDDHGRQYLQVSDVKWTGRKWMLSKHMTDGEVVQTAMAAVLAWYEHEAREAFTFMGKAIFNPHLALDALLERAEATAMRK